MNIIKNVQKMIGLLFIISNNKQQSRSRKDKRTIKYGVQYLKRRHQILSII